MARYRGLCIGGPNDGFFLQHTRDMYECVETPPLELPMSLEEAMKDVSTVFVQKHYYFYVPMARTKFGDEMGVWLHQERVNYRVPSTYDALTRFFEAYHAKANRLRFLATCGIPLPEEEVKNAQTEPPDAPTGSSGEQTRETED